MHSFCNKKTLRKLKHSVLRWGSCIVRLLTARGCPGLSIRELGNDLASGCLRKSHVTALFLGTTVMHGHMPALGFSFLVT